MFLRLPIFPWATRSSLSPCRPIDFLLCRSYRLCCWILESRRCCARCWSLWWSDRQRMYGPWAQRRLVEAWLLLLGKLLGRFLLRSVRWALFQLECRHRFYCGPLYPRFQIDVVLLPFQTFSWRSQNLDYVRYGVESHRFASSFVFGPTLTHYEKSVVSNTWYGKAPATLSHSSSINWSFINQICCHQTFWAILSPLSSTYSFSGCNYTSVSNLTFLQNCCQYWPWLFVWQRLTERL